MFVEEIRRAVMASPQAGLAALAGAVWKGYAAGALDNDQAQALAELIEARKAVRITAPPPRFRQSAGSRPRTAASLERRRRWAASGWLPPQIACRFTLAELAVLSVVAAETIKGRDCRLALSHIAAMAGVCRTTVRNALREARRLGLVTVEERRLTAWRSATNVLRIINPEWTTWLRLAAKRRQFVAPGHSAVGGGGRISATSTSTNTYQEAPRRPKRTAEKLRGGPTRDGVRSALGRSTVAVSSESLGS